MADDIRNLKEDIKNATILSQLWDSMGVSMINISSTMNTISRRQKVIGRYTRQNLKSNTKIAELNKELTKLKNKPFEKELNLHSERINQLNDEISAEKKIINSRKKQIKIQDDLIERNNLNDNLKQKYLKNQFLISLFEYKGLSSAAKKYYWIDLTLDLLRATFDEYNRIDEVVSKTRRTLGKLSSEGKHLFKQIKRIRLELSDLGVDLETVSSAIISINKSTGGVLGNTDKLVKDIAMMAKSFDIADTTSAAFLKTLSETSSSTTMSNTNMLGFVKSMSDATNIPLDDLMKDIAELSDDTRLFVKGSTAELIKATTEARRLGTTLSNISSTAKKLLNFESSIQAELKASALLGKSISFNDARRLFFQGKLIEANNAILRKAEQIKFNELNSIQMEAFADAAGKSVGELQSMLQREEDIAWIKSNGEKDDLARLHNYEKLTRLSQEQAENEGFRAKQTMLQLSNQAKLTVLQDKFKKFILELQDPLLDLADIAMDIAVKLTPVMIATIKFTSGILTGVAALSKFPKLLSKVESLLSKIPIIGKLSKFLSPVRDVIAWVSLHIESWLYKIPIIGSKIGKLFMPFMKFSVGKIPVIGWIITGLLFINNLMKDWGKFGEGWVGGLKLVASSIIKAFLPFETVYKYIDEYFMGHSPSKIGLGIVKGLKSVGSMILQAIIQPFIDGYNWIQNSFIGKLLPGGSIENPALFSDTSAASTNSNTKNQQLEDIKASNELVAKKIDELITLMSSGGIAVNLDGTKVNSALATSINRRGLRGEPTTL